MVVQSLEDVVVGTFTQLGFRADSLGNWDAATGYGVKAIIMESSAHETYASTTPFSVLLNLDVFIAC